MPAPGQTTTLHEFAAHSTTVNCLALGPKTKQLLATGGEDRLVQVWRVDNAANLLSLSGQSSVITGLAFDPSEATLASGSQGGSVKVFDLGSGKVARALTGHLAGVTALAYHPRASQQLLLSGSADTTLRLWDLRAKQCILQHKGHEAPVTAAAFSPDGRWAATGGADGVLNVWEVARPEEIFTFRIDAAAAGAAVGGLGSNKTPAVTALEFHPTLPRLATATTDKAVRLWDLESFELLATSPPTHPGDALPVRAMAFDSAGARLHTVTDKHWRALGGETLAVADEAKQAWQVKPAAAALVEADGELLTAGFNGHFVSLYATDVTGQGLAAARRRQQEQQQAQAAVAPGAPTAPAVQVKRPAVAALPMPLTPGQEEEATPTASRTTSSTTINGAIASTEEPDAPAPVPAVEAPVASVPASAAVPTTTTAASRPRSSEKSSSASQKSAAAAAAAAEGDKENNRRQQQPRQQPNQQRPCSAPAAVSKPATAAPVVDLAALSPEERLERAEKELVAAAKLHRSTLTAALSARLEMLQALAELWGKGDVARASKMAARIHAGAEKDRGRLTALADFFRVADLKTAADAGLTLELAAPLVPVAASLVGLDFENHVVVGLGMLEAMVELYGGYVKEVLATPAGGRVDLSREERVAQCRLFYDAVAAAKARLDVLPGLFKASSAVHAAAGRVKGQVGAFLG